MFSPVLCIYVVIVPRRPDQDWKLPGRVISSLDLGEDVNGDIVEIALWYVICERTEFDLNWHTFSDLEHSLEEAKSDLSRRLGIFSPSAFTLSQELPNPTDIQRYLRMEAYFRWNVFELEYVMIPIHSRRGWAQPMSEWCCDKLTCFRHHWYLIIVRFPRNALVTAGETNEGVKA